MPTQPKSQKNTDSTPPPAIKEDRQFVTALSRGLDILRCFTANRTELGTAELANLTGLPQPTVWRLCHTLVKCGFLIPSDTNDKLRIGMPVLGLGVAALSTMGFDEVIRQEMQRLALDFHAAVSLAMPDRLDMLIVQRARGDGVLLVNLHVGSRLSIGNSSFGWAYLATLAPAKRAALLKQISQAYQQDDWALLHKNLTAAIANFEQTGYIVNAGNFHPDINAIAVPVAIPDSRKTMVINCGGPAVAVPVAHLEKQIAPRLMELAETIRATYIVSQAAGLQR